MLNIRKNKKKQLGHIWIEMNNEVHTFVIDDKIDFT
jgi:hypothetical protein